MIDQETVKKARQTDLPSFLIARGEPLKKYGKRWQHKEHESLMISGNMFYWNSKQSKGNSLDFVRLYYGWDFERAIQELTGYEKKQQYEELYKQPKQEESKKLHINEAENAKRVIAYLCKTRKISYSLVKKLIENQHLSQDENNNAVFKIYDEQGSYIGAEIAGTLSEVRFKRIAEGTQTGYGFNVSIGQPKKTLFFESPIDLLSFWSMNEEKLTAHRLVSLAGLRQDIFSNTLEKFNIAPETVYLCVDNDQAGKTFTQHIQQRYPNVKIYLPQEAKDWNDLLKTKERDRENKKGKSL